MVKIVLEDREAMQRIEDRLSSVIQDVVESDSSLGPGQKKLLRNKMAQISSCFIQKVKRNTRVLKDDWSDAEEDEPDRKAQKKEHFEPEDMVLKARVEALKKKVREASERVKEHRLSAPPKMQEALKAALEKASDALKDSIAAADVPKPAQQAVASDIAEETVKAFVDDAESIASRVAKLHRELPSEVSKGRSAVKLCQEWSRKPLSSAEAIMAEGLTGKDAEKVARDRRANVLRALNQR